MKKLILSLLCVSILAVPVAAEAGDPLGLPLSDTPEYVEEIVDGFYIPAGSDFVPEVVGSYGDPPSDPLESETETESVLPFPDLDDPLDPGSGFDAVVTSSNPIGPEDTSGLKAALLKVLGNYDAIVVEYQRGSNSYYEVFPDEVWTCSFWLLAIVIFCLFRLLGGGYHASSKRVLYLVAHAAAGVPDVRAYLLFCWHGSPALCDPLFCTVD